MFKHQKNNRYFNKTLASLLFLFLLSLSIVSMGCAKSETKESSENVTYSADIQPLFEKKCTTCHSSEGTFPSLPLNSYETVKEYVKPKDAENSDLYKSVNGGSMSSKVNKDDVRTIKNWIDQGAKE